MLINLRFPEIPEGIAAGTYTFRALSAALDPAGVLVFDLAGTVDARSTRADAPAPSTAPDAEPQIGAYATDRDNCVWLHLPAVTFLPDGSTLVERPTNPPTRHEEPQW